MADETYCYLSHACLVASSSPRDPGDHSASEEQPTKDYKHIWLVVSTPLKNIRQWEGLSHISWKNKTCSKPPIRYKTEYAIFELSWNHNLGSQNLSLSRDHRVSHSFSVDHLLIGIPNFDQCPMKCSYPHHIQAWFTKFDDPPRAVITAYIQL